MDVQKFQMTEPFSHCNESFPSDIVAAMEDELGEVGEGGDERRHFLPPNRRPSAHIADAIKIDRPEVPNSMPESRHTCGTHAQAVSPKVPELRPVPLN